MCVCACNKRDKNNRNKLNFKIRTMKYESLSCTFLFYLFDSKISIRLKNYSNIIGTVSTFVPFDRSIVDSKNGT